MQDFDDRIDYDADTLSILGLYKKNKLVFIFYFLIVLAIWITIGVLIGIISARII